MKKIFIFLAISLALVIAPVVMAQQTTPVAGTNAAARLSTLHVTCDNAINQRLTNLNDASTRLNAAVKLSSDEKSTFSSQIQNDIAGLTTLKNKCDSDTDLPTLRADIKSIYTNYRVYAEFLPQVRGLALTDTMNVTISKLNSLYTKLQSRVSAAGNPNNLTTLLSDMQSKINDAQTQYNNIQSQISSLTPSSYDTNPSGTKSIFANAKSEIQTASSDLKTALSDAKQIISILKTSTTPTVTP